METETKKVLFDISSLALVKVLAVILAVVFLFLIKDVILILFVALILASAFDPWVDWLQKHRLPRPAGILLVYVLAILILGSAIYLIIPPITIEVNQLAKDFPAYWEKISDGIGQLQNYSNDYGLNTQIQNYLQSLGDSLNDAATGVFNTIYSLFGGIVSFFLILVMTFYMTVGEQSMKRLGRSLAPLKYQPYFTHLVNRMQEKIGQWLRGQLLLSFIIFLLSWLGLTILGVKYALVLALFAGVTEIIPYMGPFIGAIPAVFIGLTQSPILALMVVALYFIIQILENGVIVPKVMQKAVGLNPIMTIVVLLIGFRLAGILGVLLAVPVTTALSVVFEDIISLKNQADLK